MVAYEFYSRGASKDQLIGILPERRGNPERISEESVMNWVRAFAQNDPEFDLKDIYFLRVELKDRKEP